MYLVTLLIYLFVSYGICNIIIYANGPFHIFEKMHLFLKEKYPTLEEMMSCFICLPTWCGFFLSTVNILFFPTIAFSPMNVIISDKLLWPIIIFFDGMFTSGICWMLNIFEEMIERVGNNE